MVFGAGPASVGADLRAWLADRTGRVVLVLAEQPLDLRRWAVTDPQGLTTTVLIEQPEYGVAIDPALFRFRDPQIFGWPEG